MWIRIVATASLHGSESLFGLNSQRLSGSLLSFLKDVRNEAWGIACLATAISIDFTIFGWADMHLQALSTVLLVKNGSEDHNQLRF